MFDIVFYILKTILMFVLMFAIYQIIGPTWINFQKVCTSIQKYVIICFIQEYN